VQTSNYGVMASVLICSSEIILKGHGFVVNSGKIDEVLLNENIQTWCGEKEIPLLDYRDCIVFPGFVNAHTHMYGVFSHGIPNPTESFENFLSDYWWPTFENRIRVTQAVIAAKQAAVESIESGVTCICDTLEAPFAEQNVLEAEYEIMMKSGIRGFLSTEGSERINSENGLAVHTQNLDFAKRHKGERIQGMICSHTTFTCSEAYLRKMASDAEKFGLIWQFHLNEGNYESSCSKALFQKTTAEYLEDIGVLNVRVLASQCVNVTDKELDILAKHEVGIVHMPLSNCEVGAGVAPIPKMLQRGMCVALGSDGYINDFFSIMQAAFLLHKGVNCNAQLMPAKTVFKMATENGAKVLGLDDRIGHLEKGMDADFVVLRNEFSTPLLPETIFEQLILFGTKKMIEAVAVNGKLVLKNGRLKYLKKNIIRGELREIAESFWNRN
jgi:5-methylthioadenosine/S-adenosylhomocysteine deaminase